MDIVIIGSGNVAAVLGRKFRKAGHHILQVYSRNSSTARQLADEWDTGSASVISHLDSNAEIYVIAVPDNAIAALNRELKLPGKVVVHTAASVSKKVLSSITEHYGVFYPLQSLKSEMSSLPDIPVFYDGSDETTISKLELLARSISGENICKANDDTRLKLHVAAVLVNNFVNHLYVLAEEYCNKEHLDFKLLEPLIDETVAGIKERSPRLSQTGPAIRHDNETIQRHLEILKRHPQLKNIYILLTESIQLSS